jgi:phenylacetate-CoA ligase
MPILTRGDLEKNFEALKSSKISEYGAYESCSSGSTGQPAKFMQDSIYDMWCRAHQIRTYRWCGDWDVGDKFALVWGSPVYWDKQTLVRKIESAVTNRIELNCNNIGRSNLQKILDRLVEFQPKLISGYSTALYLVADLAASQKRTFPGLKAVQPNAEPTYDYMATTMKSQFKVPLFDKYGSTETNIIGHQSPMLENRLCVQSENTHVDFLKDDGTHCSIGEQGRIIVTTLNNFSMPLIRYQTSDLASPEEGTCPSGRGFSLMSKVQGRSSDLIIGESGDRIHPQVFSNLFSNFSQVRWFQVVQNEMGKLDIFIISSDPSIRALESTFTKMINLRTSGNFKVTYEYLQDIPTTKTGKHKICVCHIK